MEIGISTATYWPKLMTEDALKKIAECRAETAEVFLNTYSEYEPAFAEVLKKNIGEIKVHSVHTLNSQFEPQLYSPSDRTKRDAFAIFRNALRVGESIGAKYYTFHGQGRIKRCGEYRFDFRDLGKNTRAICDVAEEYGITLSYENVHWAFYYYPGFFDSLAAFCPGLKGTLDIKQSFQSGYDYRAYLREMGTRISTVHVCDYDGEKRLKPIGKGIFDFKELFTRLKDAGVDAPVMIELYAGDYKDFSEVEQSYQYLKSLL